LCCSLIDADVAVLEESCNAVRAADGLAKKDLLLGHIINKAEKRSDIVTAPLAKAPVLIVKNRRYAPAGHLLRGVWPSTMYNDHAL
jgi:hypothetical protein